jgi:hypothetical protein
VRPSPALIVASIALFVALSGIGYTAVVLPAGSVGTKQLKRGAVTSLKVKDNSLTGRDIRESRLGRVPLASRAATAGIAMTATRAVNATTAATVANGAVNADKFASLPSALAYSAVSHTIQSATFTAVPLNAEHFDTADIWSPGSPTRLTAPRTGTYVVSAAAGWLAGTGSRTLRIDRNGAQIALNTVPATSGPSQVVATITRMNAGEYVELLVHQDSGASVATTVCSGNSCPSLAIAWIGP